MRLTLGAIAVLLTSAMPFAPGTGEIAARVKFSHTEAGMPGLLVYAKRVGLDATTAALTDGKGVAAFRDLAPGLYQVLTLGNGWSPRANERVPVLPGQTSHVVLAVTFEPVYECTTSGDNYDDTPRRGRVPESRPLSRAQSPSSPRGSIYGLVTDAGGNPLPMARVHAAGPMFNDATDRRTELSGEFGIGDLPAGQYQLDVHAAGYAGRAMTVTVTGGRQVTLKLPLQPAIATPSQTGAAGEIVIDLETGFGWIRLALDRLRGPLAAADVVARLDRHELDDGNLKRTAENEIAINARPLYVTWQCGQRVVAAGRDLRAWVRIDGTATLTFETDAGAVRARVLAGADVVVRLLRQRLLEPVALLAVSMSHSSKTR